MPVQHSGSMLAGLYNNYGKSLFSVASLAAHSKKQRW